MVAYINIDINVHKQETICNQFKCTAEEFDADYQL